MSLVDYASSSDDEEEKEAEKEKENEGKEEEEEKVGRELASRPFPPQDCHQNQSIIAPQHQVSDCASQSSSSVVTELPDASLLLDLPPLSSHQMSGGDHSSRVAAAMAKSALRKRESNGSMKSYPRNKLPRGNLPHSRNVPDTAGGLLVPPQLRGRSNVVTEDIGKLFVSKQADVSH